EVQVREVGRRVARRPVEPDHGALFDPLVDADVGISVEVRVEELVAVVDDQPDGVALSRAVAHPIDPPRVDGNDGGAPGGDHVHALMGPGPAFSGGSPRVAETDRARHRTGATGGGRGRGGRGRCGARARGGGRGRRGRRGRLGRGGARGGGPRRRSGGRRGQSGLFLATTLLLLVLSTLGGHQVVVLNLRRRQLLEQFGG